MLVSAEHERLVRMLKESISLMCRSSLNYGMELNVEGLLGITLDKKDVVLVNIHESFQSPVQQDRPRPTASGLPQSASAIKDESLEDHRFEIKTEVASDNFGQGIPDDLPTPLKTNQKSSEGMDFDVIVIKEEIDDITIEEDGICGVRENVVGQTPYTVRENVVGQTPYTVRENVVGQTPYTATPADKSHDGGTEQCMLFPVSTELTSDAQRESQTGASSSTESGNSLGLPKLLQCTVAHCRYRTTLRCDMQRHLEMHGRYSQSVVRYPRQRPARWQCTYPRCRYRTASAYNFRRHQIIHTGDYLNCEQCGQRFPDEYELKEHVRLFHKGEGRCQLCNKIFSNRSSWVRHRARADCTLSLAPVT